MKYKSMRLNNFKKSEFIDYFSKFATRVNDYFYGDFGVVIIGEEVMVPLPLGTVSQVQIDFFLKEEIFDDFIYKFRINFCRGGA